MIRLQLLLAPLALVGGPALPGTTTPAPPRAGIEWLASYEDTLAAAKAQNKVVFIAVNMDGERANDLMAEKVYKDRTITALAAHSLNLVASTFIHNKSGACKRFGAVSCAEHHKVDIRVRENVLKPDATGHVIAPQHVFLGPDGKVLLSVPYQVSIEELEWCFVTALRHVDPQLDVKASSGARAPKRLVMDGVIDTSASGEEGTTPLAPTTREEALALIKEVKKGTHPNRGQALRKIMAADEPEALEFITQEMRRGGGKRSDPFKKQRGILRDAGRLSPQRYWELVAEFTESSDHGVRAEAAAAFEQLAAPESVKAIKSALRKEKEPEIEGAWLRALASTAPADKSVHKDLVKRAEKEREPTVRLQSIVALGYLTVGDDVNKAIQAAFDDKDPEVRRAACIAMAISRDKEWRKPMWAAEKSLPDGELKDTMIASLEVLTLGSLERICDSLMDVCGDTIPRERFYGLPHEKHE